MSPAAPTEQAASLLHDLRAAGVTVVAAIDVDGPADVLSQAQLDAIRCHKPALLRLLVNPYLWTCTANPHRQRVTDRLAKAWDRDPLEARWLAARWYTAMDAARDAGHRDPDAEAWKALQLATGP